MQKHKHIKALFFLGIFSMLLMHQVLPHWHLEDEVEHTHSAITGSDTHSHHHHNSEKPSPLIDFLDLFLEMHVHSVMSNDMLLTYQSIVKQLEAKKNISAPVYVIRNCNSINYDEAQNIWFYHPPKWYFNPYLYSLDLRGPPSLG